MGVSLAVQAQAAGVEMTLRAGTDKTVKATSHSSSLLTPQDSFRTIWPPSPAISVSPNSHSSEVSQTLGRGAEMPRESSGQMSYIPMAPFGVYLAAVGTDLPAK